METELETGGADPFLAATRGGRLALPRCEACRTWVWPPPPTCRLCHGVVSWEPVSGKGTVHAVSGVHGAPDKASGELPPLFFVAFVELAEGPRLMTRLIEGQGWSVGMNVEFVLAAAVTGGPQLPMFRPASN